VAGIVPSGVSGPVGGTDKAFVNVSSRGRLAVAGDALIVGFVVAGTGSRNILVRGAGPSLARFSVGDALSKPVLTLYRGNGAIIASNDNWNTNDAVRLRTAFERAGAFPLLGEAASDAALLAILAPGAYTMVVTGAAGATGSVVAEAYEVP